ncbi:type II toxin-antitoxin system VapC family toxin [Paraburkholderia caballeronis]|uniref:Ribonuclease VapC n=1 Tax=Paraburkholderia caballeronis TaxID=416943 RepID=A0A1H7FJA7_9BURK|nr:type II toxin-antitoxin system VapC family toxin [Paraburkholderia caballeronis]PXW24956.1 PIN domain nuclease of toxin-antitoxin system [Paraburkholderia caballeronis]PXX00686.1 PIN domain nuclease of toxin-antitoxin system [Paraburkholderia caballeronis]RAJ98749.1 PIN domain nuclease of toxin-antitoxin system [Paraburkholderia caballeronis]SEE71647.1 PIN domain nuclease, a component of toxin-antitoxin system (PIN domain) [Paraburkholderia caballeronis]SEK26183.1 PIN domain nuclease, a com
MIVLDTRALLYWVGGGDELSQAARAAIDRALEGGGVAISTASALEVAQYVESGHLALSMDTRSWLSTLVSIEGVRMVPVDTAIAVRAASMSSALSSYQRMVAATARTLDSALVTPDPKVGQLAHVETIW